MGVLIDSGVWIAFYNSRDELHEKATKIMNEITDGSYGSLFSTDYVLDESVNYCLTRYSPDKSILVGEAIMNTTELIKISSDIFGKSWDLFKLDKQHASDEKFLSFTDCASIIAAKMLGIKYIATFDSRFKKYVDVLY